MANAEDIRYIELKSGYSDNGPAWIGYVKTSRSGQTVYFNGKAFHKIERGMYRDIESGDAYWISGVKKDGQDRHWAGSGKILVDARAVQEYLKVVGLDALPASRYSVTEDIVDTDVSKISDLLNKSPDEGLEEENV